MRLYAIAPADIFEVVQAPEEAECSGRGMTGTRRFPGKYSDYPLKVVWELVDGEPLIITAYPLKRALKR